MSLETCTGTLNFSIVLFSVCDIASFRHKTLETRTEIPNFNMVLFFSLRHHIDIMSHVDFTGSPTSNMILFSAYDIALIRHKTLET